MMHRTLRPFAGVLFLAACGGPSLSSTDAASALRTSSAFKSAKLAYLPRVIAIPADGLGPSAASREGEAVTLEQLAMVDPVVAVLRARAEVEIEDFVSAAPGAQAAIPRLKPPAPPDSVPAAKKDSSRKDSTGGPSSADSAALRKAQRDTTTYVALTPQTSAPPAPSLTQAWTHTLRVTPAQKLENAQLAPDDGDDNADSPRPVYGGTSVARTPGWTFAIGTRELLKIIDVSDRPRMRDSIPGDVLVEFSWRWRPTAAGALFDAESAEFQSLPRTVQEAAQRGDLRLDAGPQWSRAMLARTPGGWRVTRVEWKYGEGRTPPT